MSKSYSPLHQYRISQPLAYFWPQQSLPEKLTLDSPAIMTLTDFRHVPPLMIEPNVSLDWTLLRMKREGVRMFLVINHAEQVLGLITATDILGDKPMRLSHETGQRYQDVLVRDVMTPCMDLDVIEMIDVLKASAGNVLETLRLSGRQHAIVVDTLEDGRTAIRGVFSASHLARQLDIQIEFSQVPKSFSEIEEAINHPH